MYQNLVRSVDPGAPESVHLCDFPKSATALIDEALIADTRMAMRMVSLGHAARMKAGIKVRQPLGRTLFKMRTEDEAASLKRLEPQVAEELNTKELGLLNDVADVADYAVSAIPAVVGKKYGALFPKIRAALAAGNAYEAAQHIQAGEPVEVAVDGEVVALLPEELEVRLTPRAGYAVVEEGGYVAAVSTELTPALIKEGLARELVRRIQTMRKDADFRIQDTIVVYYQAGDALKDVMQSFADYIRQETLATELREGGGPEGAFAQEASLDGETLRLALVR